MPPRLFPYAFLLALGLLSAFAIQDHRYYEDSVPVLSPEEIIALKLRLERYPKIRNQNGQYGSLPFSPLEDFRGREQQRRELERQILQDALAENGNIIHGHPPKRRQKHIPNYPISRGVDGPEENPIPREYAGRNPREFNSRFHQYPSDIVPLTEAKPALRQAEEPEYPTVEYHSIREVIQEQGMKEEPTLDFIGKHRSLDQQIPRHYSDGLEDDRDQERQEFTYRLMKPSNREEELSFAQRPGEPGYYDSEDPVSAQAGIDLKEEEQTEKILSDDEEETDSDPRDLSTLREMYRQFKDDAEDRIIPDLERRADNHSPMVTAVDRKISNDIYFVAVVAGCSAAAMFILVLISLTWCRLQRGAKAAADVEYPAYGVTGPNKDTSPSGDRRLAQSAQMYHYQHQKQQIIAMESRTATAREPGSVSEAESDEENEEGDYTVYECPGLAPTGEMEVKNPLFHDDPTPATPAGQGQSNRSSENRNM